MSRFWNLLWLALMYPFMSKVRVNGDEYHGWTIEIQGNDIFIDKVQVSSVDPLLLEYDGLDFKVPKEKYWESQDDLKEARERILELEAKLRMPSNPRIGPPPKGPVGGGQPPVPKGSVGVNPPSNLVPKEMYEKVVQENISLKDEVEVLRVEANCKTINGNVSGGLKTTGIVIVEGNVSGGVKTNHTVVVGGKISGGVKAHEVRHAKLKIGPESKGVWKESLWKR